MNKLPKNGKFALTYPKIFIVCCFLLAVFLVVYLLITVIVPALGGIYDYQRLRSAYLASGDLEWTQNIGGSQNEQNIATFLDSSDNIIIFGNTQSMDYDFSVEGGFITVLGRDGSTQNFISLGEYGIGRIVKVITAANNYIVLHDDGPNGTNVSLTTISMDLQNIGTPVDMSTTIEVTRKALEVFYNEDATAPRIIAIFDEVTNPQTQKNNIVAASFDLSLRQVSTTTIGQGLPPMLYLQSYLIKPQSLLIFANQIDQTNDTVTNALAISIKEIGQSETVNPLLTNQIDYQAMSVTPLKSGGFMMAVKTTGGNSVGKLATLTLTSDFSEILLNESGIPNLISAGFIPLSEGFYLFATFENYDSRLYFGTDNNNVLATELTDFDGVNSVDAFEHIDYIDSNNILIVGRSRDELFVMYLSASANQVIYRQSFGGSGVEQNADIILKDGVLTILCDSNSGELGKSDGDVPNNYGGFDTWVCRMDDLNLF